MTLKTRGSLLLFWAILLGACFADTRAEVKLITPNGYLPGVPFLVRVESHKDGARDWDQWDATATLTSDQPGVTLSTNTIPLRNGLGTALITINGTSNFNLKADVNSQQVIRSITNRSAQSVTTVSGTLGGVASTWTGVVRVSGTVTIPATHTLTIDPDTLVVIDGVASGTNGINLLVSGAVRSLGTESAPVVITCNSATQNWGQIRHETSQPSLYQNTLISRAGRTAGEGHTGTGPAFRVSNSTVDFESSVISDLDADGANIGKIMMATGSSLTFDNCVLTRARMGPEIASTGLVLTNSYIMDMHGPDDSDGFYLHDSGGRSLLITRCVIAGGDDDGVDTLDANATIENCIIRDWPNPNEDAKGVSGFHGEVIIRHCLIANTYAGVSTKSSGSLSVVRLDHCTIQGVVRGVAAATKSTANAGNINIYMTNCIVTAADSIVSDFTPDKFVSVTYCSFRGETWPGTGNINADPLFVAPQSGKYRLQPNSPCINTGDPAYPLDLDGTRSDMGFYPRLSAPLTEPAVVINEIMYHPQSENPLEEYIELFNQGASTVTLGGWRFSDGVNFTFPNVSLAPGAYLVVAADTNAFKAKYPGVANVIGNWSGSLSNSREDIVLDDATGNTVDRVHYADEGNWAVRQRGLLDRGHRGWTWFAAHDGLGKSVELINPRMLNSNGQNWASSATPEGTPGAANSVASEGIAPLIENISHFPLVPKSTEQVLISAKILADQGLQPSATLFFRVDSAIPSAFTSVAMHDDGLNGDALVNDRIFSALIPAHTNNAIVEFYIKANDTLERARFWPAPAIASEDGAGPTGQVVNALFQVDDGEYTGAQPLYKIVMTEAERAELQQIDDNIGSSANSDASMNATFLSFDGTGSEARYLASARNRGHGSRTRKPNNFRIGFRSDEEWKKMTALNINGQFTWLQILGAALNLRSEIPGAYSRAVQLRVNNVNLAFTGLTESTYGSYAANEPIDSDWADRHFPNDSQGNIYRALRDINPPAFDYRPSNVAAYSALFGGEDKRSYTNTFYKESNVSEDNWTDLIGMLRVIGPNGTEPFTPANASRVADVSEWMRHLAIMNLLGNNETGLNTGYNDDYFMYRGVNDPRFRLVYYDLDTILGFNNSLPDNAQLFSATNNNGSGLAFSRLMRDPAFEPLYYAHLRNLLETTFSADQFNLLVDQTLDWVPQAVRTQIKSWMDRRRAFVLSQLPATIPLTAPHAILSAAPRSPTPINGAVFSVSGENISQYKYSLNGGAFGPETPTATAITLNNLANGAQTLAVIGKRSDGVWQAEADATVVTWTVNTSWPGVRLNEILADSASGAKDSIELYNESSSSVVLTGMGLTDNSANPHKFTFGVASLAPGAYLVVDSAQLGFGLDAQGETVSLYASAANGGALLDSVTFGLQLPDFSIGRLGVNGSWQLTQPTLSAANVARPTGALAQIKINEWLASGISPFPDDFVELFNPASDPVALGGAFITDEPIGDPARSRITSLSFIAAHGYAVFSAGNGNQADEINFKIGADQGQIALLSPELAIIDQVVYGPQRTGISSGRCGDGDAAIKALNSPTPGGPNECPFVPPPPQIITLLNFTNVWKFNAGAIDLQTSWRDFNYQDGNWNSGPGPLGTEPNAIPEPVRTAVPVNPRTTYYRTHFNVDPSLTVSSLQFTIEIDDGAAFYLNGQEIPGSRYNLAQDAAFNVAANINIDNATLQTFTASADLLRSGDNVIAVEVHQAGNNSTDLVMGLKLDALVVTNSPALAGVLINEVFADNATITEADGSHPDWVELYNPSDDSVDLAGMSLTDQLTLPTRWVFPAGSILPAKGFFKIRFDADLPASSTNTGFGLKANGGAVFLYNRPSDNSSLLSSIRYGLQATDWSIGRVPDGSTNWVLTVPSLGSANIAATLGNAQNLKINEWMAEPASGSDWFEIFNANAEPVDLSHIWLSDNVTTRQKTQLPALSYIGVGSRGFQKFDADDAVSKGPDHVAFKLDGTGEALAISTAAGALINAVSFGSQPLGVSQGHLPDGSGAIVLFRGSPSPGAANFLLLDNIVVNELLSHTDPPLMDAVEFYNPSATAVDISGWYLSDSGVNLRKFQIPSNTIVPAKGYIVFYEDQFNSDLASDRFSFSSAKGDEVYLSRANNGALTGYRASASFGPAENGVSFGRFQTSQGYHFVPMAQRTFGRDNPATTNEFRLGTGATNSYAKVGPVVISEIMYHPATNEALEFIELHNIATTNVPLYDLANPANTWRLRKGADFEFATGTTIPVGGYVVVVNFDPQADPLALAAFDDAYPTDGVTIVGPFRGQLDNGGDSIELQKPDAPQVGGADAGFVPYIMVDHIDYQDAAPWPIAADGAGNSLNRRDDTLYGNDPVNWFAAAPSPGSSPIPDRDHDGIPDDWEIAHGLNPDLASDAQQDKDGDGFTNLAEYQRGTDPSDPSDPLMFQITGTAPNGVALHFGVAAGKTYSIIYSNGSPAGPWVKLRDLAPTSSGNIEITDTPGVTVRFYRLVTPALP